MKLSIRAQAIIGIGTIEIIMLMVLLYSVFHFIDGSTSSEVQRRAQSVAGIFAATVGDDVLSMDLGALQSFVEAAAKTPGTSFARIIDYNGHLLAEAGNAEALLQSFRNTGQTDSLPDLYMAEATIVKAGLHYGRVEIGLDLREQKQSIAAIKRRSVLIAAFEVIAAALFSLAAGYYLVRRLKQIISVLRRINNGEYRQKVGDSWLDEVSDIAREIDVLTDRIVWETQTRDQRIEELEELNRLLQKKIVSYRKH